jgi:hypothetical protein
MTRRKLKITRFKIPKQKKIQSSQKERHMPCFLACETSHKKFNDPQNEKKKIEDFRTSKYQNKIPSQSSQNEIQRLHPP